MKIEKDLIIKMVIAGILGILIIVSVLVIVNIVNKDNEGETKVPVATQDTESEDNEEPEEEVEPIEYERILALVRVIGESSMQVFDIEENISVTLNINGTVKFEDEYGTPIVMDKISTGYVVNVKYDKATYTPEFVKISPQIQVLKNLSSLAIDEVLKTIQIGSDIYEYTDELVALNGEEGLILLDLSIADDVIVRAYQGKIWSILVENGHGFIVLENYLAYLDGRLEIGNRTSYAIIEDMKVPVAAGVHQVIITKEEMVPYTASVLIEENGEYIIDLSDLQPVVSQVDIEIVQENSLLYINDELTELTGEPIELDFGQYNVRVENEGYMDWVGILVIDQPYIKQIIDMEVEPLQLHMTGPDGAEFYLDGVLIGIIRGFEPIIVPIVPGGHVLTLRKDNYQSWSQSVFIEDAGEDYYYTVASLEEIPQEPEPEPEPEPGEGEDEDTPGDDVYEND